MNGSDVSSPGRHEVANGKGKGEVCMKRRGKSSKGGFESMRTDANSRLDGTLHPPSVGNTESSRMWVQAQI